MTDDQTRKKYAADLTAEILTAYLANTQANVKPDEVPSLYQQLFDKIISNYGDMNVALERLPSNELITPVVTEKTSPHNSIFPDYLVCLECGKHLNTLRRHLKRTHHLNEYEYRDKYNLPSNYPMVCEEYSQKRSNIAKNSCFNEVRKKKGN